MSVEHWRKETLNNSVTLSKTQKVRPGSSLTENTLVKKPEAYMKILADSLIKFNIMRGQRITKSWLILHPIIRKEENQGYDVNFQVLVRTKLITDQRF